MKRIGKKGFTLVEIMIVVAIIALLAAIAIPNLLRARHNANESAAIGSLRTLSTAMESYRSVQIPASYAGATLAVLGAPPAGPAYIDGKLATGSKQGYTFTLVVGAGAQPQTYTIDAIPQAYQTTGSRSFQVTQTGVITGGLNGGAAYAVGGGTAID